MGKFFKIFFGVGISLTNLRQMDNNLLMIRFITNRLYNNQDFRYALHHLFDRNEMHQWIVQCKNIIRKAGL